MDRSQVPHCNSLQIRDRDREGIPTPVTSFSPYPPQAERRPLRAQFERLFLLGLSSELAAKTSLPIGQREVNFS